MKVDFEFEGVGEQSFTVNVVPRKGDHIHVSFTRRLRIEEESPGYYSEEAVRKYTRLDGSQWVVGRVIHQVECDRDASIVVFCTKL